MNHEMVKQAYDEICGLEKEAVTVDGNKIFLDKEDYEVLPYTVKDRMKDLAKSPAGKALAGVGLTAAGVGALNALRKREKARKEEAAEKAAAYYDEAQYAKEAALSDYDEACAYEAAALEVLDELGYLD